VLKAVAAQSTLPLNPGAPRYLAKVQRLGSRKAIQNQPLSSSVLNPRSREVWRQTHRRERISRLGGTSQCGGLLAEARINGEFLWLASPVENVGREQTGGEGGIRTPDTATRMPHFECGAFNHSATSPWPPRRIRRLCIQRKTAKQGRSEPPRSTLPAEIALRAIEIAIMSMSLFCVRRPAGMPTKMGLRRAQRGPGMLDFQAQHEGG
jgi:hypothetical protein